MSADLQQIERIESYLMDRLSSQEKERLENELKENEQLQRKVSLQKEIMMGIERIGLKNEISVARKYYKKRNNGYYFGGFVLLILIIAVSIYTMNNTDRTVNEKQVKGVTTNLKESQNKKRGESKKEGIKEDGQIHPTSETKIEPAKESETNPFKWPTKKGQIFKIQPDRDTSIIGNEGTIIDFKANSFVVNSANPITIKLKEYYRLSEMLFDQLTTQTMDSEILESGGMLHLEAFSEEGRELSLKEKAIVTVNFPKRKRLSGHEEHEMTTYYGDRGADHNVYWEKAKSQLLKEWQAKEIELPQLKERITTIGLGASKDKIEFIHHNESVDEYIEQTIRYSKSAVREKIQGTIKVNYTINLKGRIEEVKVIRVKGVPRQYYEDVINLVKSFPVHKPLKARGKYVPTSFQLEIPFNSKNAKISYDERKLKAYYDSILQVRKEEKDFSPEMGEEMELRKKESIQDKVTSGSVNQEVNSEELDFYVLSSSRLGWINCDRPIKSKGPRIDVFVDREYKDAKIRLIFHEELAILNAQEYPSGASFIRLPKGKKVSIYALRKAAKGWEVCLMESQVSPRINGLVFKSLTAELLEATTNELNAIHER